MAVNIHETLNSGVKGGAFYWKGAPENCKMVVTDVLGKIECSIHMIKIEAKMHDSYF